MEGGWIKIYRRLLEWQWSSSSNHIALFIHILLRANYKETKWRKETIAPGQLLTGSKQLSDWTGLSRMQIRKSLTDLVTSEEITIKTTNKYSIITILKWETYQSEQPTNNQQVTNKEPASNQQVTTSKKAKNIKKEKKVRINISPLAFLFSPDDEIHEWLLTGTEAAQKSLLESHSPHVLVEEIKKAYLWQLEKTSRDAGTFLVTWMSNINTQGFGFNSAQKSFKSKTNGVVATPQNPTGNPYIQEALEKGLL